jgi:hypothetical protein
MHGATMLGVWVTDQHHPGRRRIRGLLQSSLQPSRRAGDVKILCIRQILHSCLENRCGVIGLASAFYCKIKTLYNARRSNKAGNL